MGVRVSASTQLISGCSLVRLHSGCTMPLLLDLGLQGHVALVTGANHGIGAATALILASHGAAVVVSYLRIPDPGESAGPEAYRRSRAMDAEHVLTSIAEKGGRAIALEADLGDVGSSARL